MEHPQVRPMSWSTADGVALFWPTCLRACRAAFEPRRWAAAGRGDRRRHLPAQLVLRRDASGCAASLKMAKVEIL